LWEPNGELIRYLESELHRLGVDIRLECEVTADFVKSFVADAVVIAVGAKRELPDIPGANLPNVFSGDALRKLRERWMPLDKDVLIIGGGLVGLELAEFLVERGSSVTVVEESPSLAPQMSIPRRWRTLHVLREHGAKLLCRTRVKVITEAGALVETAEGETQLLKANQILIASGAIPNRELADSLERQFRLEDQSCDVHVIGDSNEVGYIEGAMLAGARLGRSV